MSGKVTDIADKRKKKAKKKIKNKKILKILIISSVIGYFLIRALPVALSSYIKTETVEKETFVDSLNTKGLVIKDEHVYYSGPESLEIQKEEGQRIGGGETIAVSRQSDYKSQEERLSQIDADIKLYEELLNEYSWLKGLDGDKEKAVEDYISHLKEKLNLEDESLEKSIRADIDNNADSSEPFFAEKVEKLKAEKVEIEESLQSGTTTYVSKVPGMLSTSIDGLETEISVKTIEKLDFSRYNSVKGTLKEGTKVSEGVKLVEGHKWFLAIDLEKNYKKELEGKESLEVSFTEIDLKLTGSIEKIEEGEGRIMLVLGFNEGLHRVYNQRYLEVSLVKGEYSGLKVPSSAITEKDGIRGVFTKDVSGIVTFVPVRVLYKGKEDSIVNEEEQGIISVKKDGEASEARALQVFDEVFRNSLLVRENQVIN